MDEDTDDDALTDAWEHGAVFPGGVSHGQHLRIAWTLLRRHHRAEAVERIVSGTRRACAAHGVPERFDESITRHWADLLGGLADAEPDLDAARLLSRHPELADGRRFGSRS